MAAKWQHWFLASFLILCVINGVFSAIWEVPENELVVLCEDNRGRMNCTSNTTDQIAWTYDGNTVINARCLETTPVFVGESTTSDKCDIIAKLDEARTVDNIRTISGPYGCTDQTNDGITETSMIVILDMWCGLLNTCPAREGDAVTVGCFVQYDWLSFLLQYRPIVSMNVSLQFLEDGSTLVRHTPDVPSPQPGPQVPPDSVLSHTTYTTTAGETWVNATCMVEFLFTRAPTAYSNRNRYSETTLRRTCTISQRVPYCPINVRIYPSSTCEAFEVLNCTADSYPEPFIYVWIDHANNDQITYGQTFSLQPGNYSLTCMAFTNITCHPQNRMCQDVGSYLAKNLNDTDSVFSTLFNAATPNYGYSEICNGSASISGYAVLCPNMTLEALNGSWCSNSNELVIMKPSVVAFECIFELESVDTTYTWTMDNSPLTQFTTRVAYIDIPSGSHRVSCRGYLEVTGANIEDCTCDETRSIDVIVVECADNVTISPSKECVMQEPPTTFMCSATYGSPGDPVYSWTHVFGGTTSTGTGSSYSDATAVGDHTLTCSATYTHTACPQFEAVCSATTEVRVFECPEMTLDANSPSRCPAVCNEELVLTKRDVVTLQCNYENPSSSTPTVYTWYVNDLPDPTLTGSTVDVSFPNSHSYNVRCTANNTESADCSCIASRNITVSVVECTSPTLQPLEVCVPPGEEFTCMGATGYPESPDYTFTYWHESGMTSSGPPPYTVNQLGHFSLFCDATYRHDQCPGCYAMCFANFTGLVYDCPDNISLYHNASQYTTPSPLYNDALFFNASTVMGFQCIYLTIYTDITSYKWYVNGELQAEMSKYFEYYFEAAGDYVVKCEASYTVADNCTCNRSTEVPINIEVPPDPCCPFPHWPPIIPPIIAILLSLLMIPCYCCVCGPWSGRYWAEERRKLMMMQETCQIQPRPQTTCSPMRMTSCDPCIRQRPLTNGYGRL